jgi:hypothetical protein
MFSFRNISHNKLRAIFKKILVTFSKFPPAANVCALPIVRVFTVHTLQLGY